MWPTIGLMWLFSLNQYASVLIQCISLLNCTAPWAIHKVLHVINNNNNNNYYFNNLIMQNRKKLKDRWTILKVKVLGYSLHPLILLCRLEFSQIISPVHSWFHLNSPGRIQPGCSLVHTTDQLTIPWLPSLYHLKNILWYESAVEMDLPKAPTMANLARIRSHEHLIIGLVP